MIGTAAAALTAAAVLGLALVGPAAAVDAGDLTLTVSPARLELPVTADGGPVTRQITVTVAGGDAPAAIGITLADVVPDATGGWAAVAAGSTPYSLAAVTTTSPDQLTYRPGSAPQVFTIAITVRASPADPPRAGIITIGITPASPDPSGQQLVRQTGEIQVAAVCYAAGASTASPALQSLSPALRDGGLRVTREGRSTPLDAVIGDVAPGLLEDGPVAVSAGYTNTGDVVLDASTAYTFEAIGPIDWITGSSAAGQVLARHSGPSGYALPGQSYAEPIGAVSSTDATGADALPAIGFVRITAATTGALGPLHAQTVIRSMIVFVGPWKEALVLLCIALAVLLRKAPGRMARAIARRLRRRAGWRELPRDTGLPIPALVLGLAAGADGLLVSEALLGPNGPLGAAPWLDWARDAGLLGWSPANVAGMAYAILGAWLGARLAGRRGTRALAITCALVLMAWLLVAAAFFRVLHVQGLWAGPDG